MLKRKIQHQELNLGYCIPAEEAPSLGAEVLTGLVSMTPRGFGFVTTAAGVAYFLSMHFARRVLPGDVLQFVLAPKAGADSRRDIQALLHVRRDAGRLVCEANFAQGEWQLTADEPSYAPLALAKAEDTQGICVGDVVAVRFPAYAGPVRGHPIPVRLEKNLGARVREGFLREYLAWRYGFEKALPALEPVETPTTDVLRQDIRHIPFVTIDGESTLDLDDAIYVASRGSGWQVQVAVADVASAVPEGSALDLAAAERGTSLYLAGKVIPMLPEELSTGACSLQEGLDRRVLVLRFNLDAAGQVTEPEFFPAWIKSAARLNYTQVNAWLSGGSGVFNSNVAANLTAMAQAYRVLRQLRQLTGILEFDEPEPKLTVEDGSVNLQWEVRNEAHKLVETYMLLANQVTAVHLIQRYGVAILRKQPPPSQLDWAALRHWAQTATGFDLPEQPSRLALTVLSRQGGAEAQAVAAQKIRSVMRAATYVHHSAATGADDGHFSLGVSSYTHFTSPIRRYVDLATHRLLLKPAGYQLTDADRHKLKATAARCAARATTARQAERYLWDQLKLSALVARVAGHEALAGRIVRLNPQGARVYVSNWQVMGSISAEHLKAAGYHWSGKTWDKPGCPALSEGAFLLCYWVELQASRPAHPELLLRVTAPQS